MLCLHRRRVVYNRRSTRLGGDSLVSFYYICVYRFALALCVFCVFAVETPTKISHRDTAVQQSESPRSVRLVGLPLRHHCAPLHLAGASCGLCLLSGVLVTVAVCWSLSQIDPATKEKTHKDEEIVPRVLLIIVFVAKESISSAIVRAFRQDERQRRGSPNKSVESADEASQHGDDQGH